MLPGLSCGSVPPYGITLQVWQYYDTSPSKNPEKRPVPNGKTNQLLQFTVTTARRRNSSRERLKESSNECRFSYSAQNTRRYLDAVQSGLYGRRPTNKLGEKTLTDEFSSPSRALPNIYESIQVSQELVVLTGLVSLFIHQ